MFCCSSSGDTDISLVSSNAKDILTTSRDQLLAGLSDDAEEIRWVGIHLYMYSSLESSVQYIQLYNTCTIIHIQLHVFSSLTYLSIFIID